MQTEIHIIHWHGIEITLTFTPEKFGLVDHLELSSHKRVPLPVTQTGYRSNFLPKGTIAARGGAVAFALAWLDEEAKTSGWSQTQLSLF